VIDVTRVRIQKPQGRNEKNLYSAKDKFHAIKFEVVSTIKNPKIVWVSAGYAGKDADISIARDGFLARLNPGEKTIADLGYRGRDEQLVTPIMNPVCQAEIHLNEAIHRKRQIIERMNKRLKQFNCLNIRWRHQHTFLNQCFHSIALITTICLYYQPLNTYYT
jgi:hypothetical protein